MCQTQSLWERLTGDFHYHRVPEPERWLRAAFRREAAAMREAKRLLEEPQSVALGRGSLDTPVVGKRTLVEVEMKGRGVPYAADVRTSTPVQDPLARPSPAAADLPFRAEVDDILGASLHVRVEKPEHGARGTGAALPRLEMISAAQSQAQAVQFRSEIGRDVSSDMDAAEMQELAAQGVIGSGDAMPHADAIARSFGPEFDISGLQAHVGGTAARANEVLGAHAYASGNRIAFASAPDLHTAAHEATHAVLQLRGIAPASGVGAKDDAFERHADAVADAVVAGRPAASLLAQMSGGAKVTGNSGLVGTSSVQLKRATSATPANPLSGKQHSNSALGGYEALLLEALTQGDAPVSEFENYARQMAERDLRTLLQRLRVTPPWSLIDLRRRSTRPPHRRTANALSTGSRKP